MNQAIVDGIHLRAAQLRFDADRLGWDYVNPRLTLTTEEYLHLMVAVGSPVHEIYNVPIGVITPAGIYEPKDPWTQLPSDPVTQQLDPPYAVLPPEPVPAPQPPRDFGDFVVAASVVAVTLSVAALIIAVMA